MKIAINMTWIRCAAVFGILVLSPLTVHSESTQLVAVAGATGRTGVLVTRLLERDERYHVRALVRDSHKAKELLDKDTETRVVDVKRADTLKPALQNISGLIIAIGSGGDWFGPNGPEYVDYGGVRNLVEAAKEAGVAHIVLISSMGVTQIDHMLNQRFNDILLWKLLGENVLRRSGLAYTIIRPGGLKDEPGGSNGIRFGQGDNLGRGTINRADVALTAVQALFNPATYRKTFEILNGNDKQQPAWMQVFATLEADPEPLAK